MARDCMCKEQEYALVAQGNVSMALETILMAREDILVSQDTRNARIYLFFAHRTRIYSCGH